MQDIGKFYERVKHEYIYPKYFPIRANFSNKEFENAILDAYSDIVMLIPSLGDKGRQDEDYYLGEWLVNERSYYGSIKYKDNKDAAYLVYSIRKKMF